MHLAPTRRRRRRDMRKTGPLSLARFLLLDGGIAEDLTGQKGAREGCAWKAPVLSSVGCGVATLLSLPPSLPLLSRGLPMAHGGCGSGWLSSSTRIEHDHLV